MRKKWLLLLLGFSQSIMANTGKIDDILNRISVLYVDAKPVSQLQEETIEQIVSSLDKYSTYLPRQQATQFNETIDGEYHGLGLAITMLNHELSIDNVLPNSPADKVGLTSGDIITHINGQPIDKESLEANTARLRNQKKSHMTLTLKPNRLIKIKRDKINREFIQYENKGQVGYIGIYLFTKKTPTQLQELLQSTNHDAYLIDLRQNPGGLLYASIKSSTLFLDPQEDMRLTHIENRHGLHDVYIEERSQDYLQGKPLYVLIGPHSASGAELFASILQHYDRATILGETSKGKGSIQALVPLADESFLKLTTAYFTSPDGSTIHEHGVEPNVHISADSVTPSLAYISENLN